MAERYYNEGDRCPKCKVGMVVIMQCNQTGENTIKCQDCFHDVTDLKIKFSHPGAGDLDPREVEKLFLNGVKSQ